MMKKLILFSVAICIIYNVEAQLTLKNGAQLVVKSGSSLIATSGISASNGTIDNEGIIQNRGDLINNTTTLFGSSSNGTFIFNGSNHQEISGDHDAGFYGTIEIDNANGVSISNSVTGSLQTFYNSFVLTNGTLTLNEFDLLIGTTDPSGITSSRYIHTNSTGSVWRNVPADGTTDVLFPIGNSSYNPVILKSSTSGISDSYGVRVVDHEPANSNTSHLVNRSWQITENQAGGSDLSVTPEWIGSQELAGFNRGNCAVGLTNNAGITYEWKEHGAASGTDPYSRTGFPFTSLGTFAVADYYFSIPDNLTVSNTSIGSNDSECFDAKQVLTVAGDGDIVEIASGGEGIFVAGQTIFFKHGFRALNGSYMHGYITTNNTFCGSQPPPIVASPQVNEVQDPDDLLSNLNDINQEIRIYPNPTGGIFSIEFLDQTLTADIFIMTYQGQQVFRTATHDQFKIDINISYLPVGIYLIIIKSDSLIITKKLIKR